MDFLNDIFRFENNKTIIGLTEELNIFYILEAYKKHNSSVIVLTSSLYEANKIFSLLKTYEENVWLFPMDDFLTSVAIAVSPELKVNRLETLDFLSKKSGIVVTNLMGYLRYLPDVSSRSKLKFKIEKDSTINRDLMIETLEKFGYNREEIVTSTGEYAIRGFVIDIFPVQEEHPIRIEFFGNDVESIRYYDEDTQLSTNNIKQIEIKPYKEITTSKFSSLYEYANDPLVITINESQIKASYKKLQEEIFEYKTQQGIDENNKFMFDLDEVNPKHQIYISTLDNSKPNGDSIIAYDSKSIPFFNSDFEAIRNFYNDCLAKNKKVVFCLSKDNQERILKKHLGSKVNIIKKRINKGFIINDYVVISEFDIENTTTKEIKYKNSYRIGRKLRSFNQLAVGDYVVHPIHGIGIYNGIITLTKDGIKKDYIQVNYLGNDKIYIPVEKISSIYKYAEKEGTKPKINKLNSLSWKKTKAAVAKKVHDISEELIKLYAARKEMVGPIYKSYPEETVFGNSFIYEETKDQQKAIKEIDADLSQAIPMDRLLCGDVGFGKTEVSFRAIFKAVLNNKQVMYLCPTTILSKQQYQSAIERFKDYPIEIALLNRFTTKKESTKILEKLESGAIDIIFGTHRLLSDDVKFAKLGLLIVDEEQRFGVTHKEKIKKLKNDINVLTLSATPIPRTLKMALSGLRDLSVIDTPPVNRYPIQTYVMLENDLLIKDALYKELSRGGQAFVLYNNISKLEDKKVELQKLIPDAKIVCAHGQMSKSELDSIMEDFVDNKYDILLCTTIIETGIDIANANTLIVYDADHFGLSQLYQIRGRVGRSNRIAYAYLLYGKDKILNESAIKRLQAIKDFTELGSGYQIATRDLAIRGAGDLLGSEQAGFVDAVGISLYMKMIEDEIKRQNGENISNEDEETSSLVNVETHIDDNYVSEENLKIEIHQKINTIDSYQKLLEVKNELIDRFGNISSSLEIYMYEEWFEKIAKKLNITKVYQDKRIISFELSEDISNKLKPDVLFMEAYSINSKFNFKYRNKRIIISLPLLNIEKHFLYYLVPLLEKISLMVIN